MSLRTHGFNDQELGTLKPAQEARELYDALIGPPVAKSVEFLSHIRVPEGLVTLGAVRRNSDGHRHVSTQRH
jgi:hypothetical protein